MKRGRRCFSSGIGIDVGSQYFIDSGLVSGREEKKLRNRGIFLLPKIRVRSLSAIAVQGL